MFKVPAAWISQNLSEHDLRQWVALSGNLLALYTSDKTVFRGLFIGDKI